MRDVYAKKIFKQKVARVIVIAWFVLGLPVIVAALWWGYPLIGNIQIPEVVFWVLGVLIFGTYFWSLLKLDSWAESVGPTIEEQVRWDKRLV